MGYLLILSVFSYCRSIITYMELSEVDITLVIMLVYMFVWMVLIYKCEDSMASRCRCSMAASDSDLAHHYDP